MRTIVIVFIIFTLFICNCTHKNDSVTQTSTPSSFLIEKSQCHNCFYVHDSIYSNCIEVKYIQLDSIHCGIFIDIDNNVISILKHTYSCQAPKGLIHKYLFHKDCSTIVFERGYGFHYREVVVVELIANKVVMNSFETEKELNTIGDYCFYKLLNDSNKVLFHKVGYSRLYFLELPNKSVDMPISKFKNIQDSVVIEFANDESLSLLIDTNSIYNL